MPPDIVFHSVCVADTASATSCTWTQSAPVLLDSPTLVLGLAFVLGLMAMYLIRYVFYR